MYERLLVPTDGSAHSDPAVEHAMDLAEQFGATIHTLFVVDQTGLDGHWDFAVEKGNRSASGRWTWWPHWARIAA